MPAVPRLVRLIRALAVQAAHEAWLMRVSDACALANQSSDGRSRFHDGQQKTSGAGGSDGSPRLGHVEEARDTADRIRTECPSFTVEDYIRDFPIIAPAALAAIRTGAAKARLLPAATH